jgi:uncharacterized protein (TIGR03437 family)
MRPHILCFCLVLCAMAADAPVPSITSATPNLIDAGGPYFLITVNGSRFVSGAVVKWTGTPLNTTFVSSTQLKAAITPELRAYSGKFDLTVTNSGGMVSGSYPITVSPVLAGITPSAALAGSPAVTIAVKGIGFTRREVLALNDSGRPLVLLSSYVDSATLTAVIPADALSIARAATIQVLDPLDGNISGSLPFGIRSAPAIASALPSPIDAGGPYFLLAVTGTGFVPDSAASWPNVRLGTTFVSSTQLRVAITPELRSVSGTFNLTVTDLIGAVSNSYPITVSPVLFSISPTASVAGGPAVTITATGMGFTRDNVLVFSTSGQPSQLVTTYLNATTLTAAIPAGALLAAGFASAWVADSKGTGRSLARMFTVSAPVPTITSFSPGSATAGAAAFTLTVNGTNFVPGSAVLWNGAALFTSFVSASQLTALVPAALTSTTLSPNVAVSNPSGAVSISLVFPIDQPRAVIADLSPASVIAGAPSFTLTVTGRNFAINCVLQWNGSPLSTKFAGPAQVSATVPESLVAAGGTATVTLINPSGSASNAATFTVNPPAPTIASLNPSSVPGGGPAFTLVVNGAGFVSGDAILWNNVPLATTGIGPTQLTAAVPAILIAAAGVGAIAVARAGAISNLFAFTITPPLPSTTTAGVVNTASLAPSIAPGSLISIYGAHLAAGDATASSTPLPTSLIGTSVTINGIAAPLVFVSPALINAQAPVETKVGTATLLIQAGPVASAPVAFEVTETGPGVLTIPHSDHALAQNYPDGETNSAESPTQPGQYVVVYLTGQGRVDPPVATGAAAPASPLSVPLATIQVQVGGKEAHVGLAGLAPGFVGLLQLVIEIPEVASGEQSLDVSIGGMQTNSTVLSVNADQFQPQASARD